MLVSAGVEVIGYSLAPPSTPSFFVASGLGDRIADTRGDVNDYDMLLKCVHDFKPDVVFHLAAQPLVRRSYAEPVLTMETNIIGTVKLLEAVRHAPSVQACVCITSDKCYQNSESRPMIETDPMGGHDPYSASKGAAELVISSYRESFLKSKVGREVGLASARAGNVIGGGDWAEDRILPDCVRHLSSNRPITLRNPRAVRPWQHVMEPLHGYLMLAAAMMDDRDKFSSSWNFGPKKEDHISVLELARRVVDRWGKGVILEQGRSDGLHEAMTLRLDCTKAQTLLGWAPVTDVDQAVKLSVDWYQDYYCGRDVWETTNEQIRWFMERAWGEA
jgi:CDP-glucose 4,6-dehydratase